tara:strand:- start:352 stop:603 length:252 start_codon:yes stop_codon:yes gene_type:complete
MEQGLATQGILNLPNLMPSEKLVLIQIMTAKMIGVSRVNVQTSATQLGYTRCGWRKVALRLIDKGYITNEKRGHYEIANTNIF